MDVTWDTAKNQKNIDKRHLPLSLGGLVLDDEMRIERHDKEHSTSEQDRWQTRRKEVILWRERFTGGRLVQG